MGNKTDKTPSERSESDDPRAARGTYPIHWEDIVCSRCANKGRLQWEEGLSPDSKHLVGIEGNFYERLTKKSWQIELVCNGCGAVLPRRIAASKK